MGARSSSDLFFVRPLLGPDPSSDVGDPTIVDIDPPTLEESLGIREIRRALEQALRSAPGRASKVQERRAKSASRDVAGPRRSMARRPPPVPTRVRAIPSSRSRSLAASVALMAIVGGALMLRGYGGTASAPSTPDATWVQATAAVPAPSVTSSATDAVHSSPALASPEPASPTHDTKRPARRPR